MIKECSREQALNLKKEFDGKELSNCFMKLGAVLLEKPKYANEIK